MAIFKKNGRWFIDYRVDGKRYRECVGVSHTLAKQAEAKRLAEVAEGKFFPSRLANGKTFAEIAEKYWSLHGQHLRSPSWKAMFGILKAEFGMRKIGSITPADVQRFYNEKAAQTSYSTANRYLTLLKSFYNKAELWGDFHGVNPCTRVTKGREAAHRLRYLSHDEMGALLERAHPRLYPVLMCALLTGMRRGEMLNLKWENINLEKGVVYILESKSGKPREVPIPSKLHDVLVTLSPKPAGIVFELPVIMLRRYFDKALRDSGIVGFHFHDLRHTFASYFLMQTNDLPALQKLLGHSTPAMTQRYAHLSRGHMASNIAAFESSIPTKSQAPVAGWTPIGHQAVASDLPA